LAKVEGDRDRGWKGHTAMFSNRPERLT
jgi:hypothetical protein